jgi:hypothetical protein
MKVLIKKWIDLLDGLDDYFDNCYPDELHQVIDEMEKYLEGKLFTHYPDVDAYYREDEDDC